MTSTTTLLYTHEPRIAAESETTMSTKAKKGPSVRARAIAAARKEIAARLAKGMPRKRGKESMR